MRALTIRQPWAHAIVHLGKTVENRTWDTRFRGDVLIHAAKGCTHAEYKEGADFCARVLGRAVAFPSLDPRHAGALLRGGIVARARIVDVIPALGRGPRRAPPSWHVPEQFGFVLADVQPTPFVPCSGALGFWDVPQSVLDALRGAP